MFERVVDGSEQVVYGREEHFRVFFLVADESGIVLRLDI